MVTLAVPKKLWNIIIRRDLWCKSVSTHLISCVCIKDLMIWSIFRKDLVLSKVDFWPPKTLQMGTFGPLGVVKTPVFTKIISRVPSIHFKNSQREPHRTRFSLSNANFVFEIWPGYVQVTWATKSDFGCFGPPNPPKTPIFWGFWS